MDLPAADSAPAQLIILSDDETEDGWLRELPGARVVSELDYLTGAAAAASPSRIVNLSSKVAYQQAGYYVSLLAAARGHAVLPSAATLMDAASPMLRSAVDAELAEVTARSLAGVSDEHFVLLCYFGRPILDAQAELGRALFSRFPLPLLRAELMRQPDGRWSLSALDAMSPSEVPAAHRELVLAALLSGAGPITRPPAHLEAPVAGRGCRVAILINHEEPEPPSNGRARERFLEAASALGMHAELITAQDASRLAEFDALFIRETTALWNHTYALARRAAALGLFVIDDADSILRCCNKVFLGELFARHGVAAPGTRAVHPGNVPAVIADIGLPCILKQPDGWSSRGMLLVSTEQELRDGIEQLLGSSALLVAQEFVPSGFDWRIGVFGGEPIYASKYYMVPDHWQVVRRDRDGMRLAEGPDEPVALELVPPAIRELAVRAAGLIGDGFYGVDLKEVGDRSLVIEVNDNPSVDAGIEDTLLEDELYRRILRWIGAGIARNANPIRRATRTDLAALVELEEAFPSDRISRRAYARLLSRPSAEVWVYADGPRILGSMVLLFRAGSATGRLYSIAVRLDARGRGLASRLLALGEARCRDRDCHVMRLEVRAEDARVCDFYRARGFAVTDELPSYYEDGAAALRMEKRLPQHANGQKISTPELLQKM